MVTQNEDGPIDFDYNLNVLSCDDFYDCKKIKELVRLSFNKVLRSRGLQDCDDSTSSLTTKLIYFSDESEIKFYIDLAIVTENIDGFWERLIHDKNSLPNRYFWNQAPNSKGYENRAKKIKEVPGMWDKVRAKYLEKKNMYLTRNDYNHPSFICYIESVNEIYFAFIQNN